MKLRTLEDLSDHLDGELAWRKKELLSLKGLIDRQSKNRQESALLRSAVALLYGHWEGFVKAGGTAYLNFVSHRNLRCEELADHILALEMRQTLNDASSAKKASVHAEVVNFLRSGLSIRSNIPWKSAVETKSNLKSEVFREIACALGIDYSLYQTKEKLLDDKLLAVRNNIAHGERFEVSYEAYCELHTEVIDLLQLFRNQVDNAASTESYRSSARSS